MLEPPRDILHSKFESPSSIRLSRASRSSTTRTTSLPWVARCNCFSMLFNLFSKSSTRLCLRFCQFEISWSPHTMSAAWRGDSLNRSSRFPLHTDRGKMAYSAIFDALHTGCSCWFTTNLFLATHVTSLIDVYQYEALFLRTVSYSLW